jgi:hypothetical protein
MKKFMKSKLFLAIIGVAVISSVIMAGTYSWFVSENTTGTVGGTAVVKAATFDLKADGSAKLVAQKLTVFASDTSMQDLNITADEKIVDVAELNDYMSKLYPSEGVRFTLATAAEDGWKAVVTGNRDIVLAIDVSSLAKKLDSLAVKNDDGTLYFEVTADEAVEDGSIYYRLIPANGGTVDIDAILSDFVIDFGIIGVNKSQNDLIGKELLNFAFDDKENLVDVQIVQATEAAVTDILGEGVWALVTAEAADDDGDDD